MCSKTSFILFYLCLLDRGLGGGGGGVLTTVGGEKSAHKSNACLLAVSGWVDRCSVKSRLVGWVGSGKAAACLSARLNV